jgi:hypothetical protein
MSALSTTARHEYYAELANSLPPPVLASPEIRHRRLTTAVEAFEALRPGDAYEARLAVQVVLCGAHAAESLREAGVHRENFTKSSRCRAQAASMMREERAAKRMLAQEQKVRLATEAVTSTPVANTSKAQPTTVSPQPPQAESQAAAPSAAQAAAPPPAPAVAPVPPAMQAAPPSPEAIANAEAYALKNSVAAAQIRHDRGVTPQNTAYFRHLTLPTDPALIDALVRGTTLTLTLLDDVGGETLDAAA